MTLDLETMELWRLGDQYLGQVSGIRGLLRLAAGEDSETDRTSGFLADELQHLSQEEAANFSNHAQTIAEMLGKAIDGEATTPLAMGPTSSALLWTLLTRLGLKINTREQSSLIYKSMLSLITSDFELLVGKLVKALIRSRPGLINGDESLVTLARIVELGSIDAVVDEVIDKKVDDLLRQSLESLVRMVQ